jgi:hypothetical protein
MCRSRVGSRWRRMATGSTTSTVPPAEPCRPGSILPCPADRSGMLTRLLTGHATTPRDEPVQDGTALQSPRSKAWCRPGEQRSAHRVSNFRFRCATAASPPDSCPRGGGHPRRASPSGRGRANGATVCEGHPRWPCH